jgi:hypothetical protein
MIGGFKSKVTDIDFKYTTKPSRIFWVKTFYPHLGKLVHAIREIDYNSYEYSGPYTFTVQYSTGWNNYRPNPNRLVFDEHVIDIKRLECNFFGGICYELLNDSSRNTPPLSNYVDPTGDIDIAIICRFPDETKEMTDKWNEGGEYNGCVATLVINSLGVRKVNDYYLHAARWIHSKLVEIVAHLQLDIPNSVDFDISEYYIQDTLEFIDIIVGKSHVIMYVEGGHTIKIQLIYKIVSEDGITILDHVVEFLITPPEDDLYIRKVQIIGGAEIQNMMDLFNDNLEAHQKRAHLILTDDRHKPINHTARILYLFEYIKQNNLLINWRNYYGVFMGFIDHPSYNLHNQSLMYYKIMKGVFESFDLKFTDVLSAYGDIIKSGGLGSFPYKDANYTMIQALVLNNVREKSIPKSLKDSINSTRVKAESRSVCYKLFSDVQTLSNNDLALLVSDKISSVISELIALEHNIHKRTRGISEQRVYPVMEWLHFYRYIIPDEWNDGGNLETTLVGHIISDFRNSFKQLKHANNIPSIDDLSIDVKNELEGKGDRNDLTARDNDGTNKLLICAYLSISKCPPPKNAHHDTNKARGKRTKKVKRKRTENKRKKKRTNKKY